MNCGFKHHQEASPIIADGNITNSSIIAFYFARCHNASGGGLSIGNG
jgi:hypothetical protein